MKFKESKSIYLQIADRICDEILQGQYKEEERIRQDIWEKILLITLKMPIL